MKDPKVMTDKMFRSFVGQNFSQKFTVGQLARESSSGSLGDISDEEEWYNVFETVVKKNIPDGFPVRQVSDSGQSQEFSQKKALSESLIWDRLSIEEPKLPFLRAVGAVFLLSSGMISLVYATYLIAITRPVTTETLTPFLVLNAIFVGLIVAVDRFLDTYSGILFDIKNRKFTLWKRKFSRKTYEKKRTFDLDNYQCTVYSRYLPSSGYSHETGVLVSNQFQPSQLADMPEYLRENVLTSENKNPGFIKIPGTKGEKALCYAIAIAGFCQLPMRRAIFK